MSRSSARRARLVGRTIVVALEHRKPGDTAGRAHDDERIAEAARREDRGLRAGKREHRVRRLGGGVHHPAGTREERLDLQAERAGRVGETVEDAALEVGGRGERLAHRHAAARAVDGDDVGERSADVDRNGVHGYSITRIVQSLPPLRQIRRPTSSMSAQYCGWMRPMWLTA